MAITRKNSRQFEMVRFESDLFDGQFELPALSSFDLKTQRHIMNNNVNPLFDLLREAGVPEDALDAIDSLAGDEVSTFMKEWGAAGPIPAPKSGR